MRITDLEAHNMAAIFVGMGITKIHVDFEMITRIVLFEGPSGSGKTAVASILHPFAYNEVDDNRDNNSLILEGKDGYKSITYDDKYVCRHFYKRTGDKLIVKSYFSVDGEELNANGNVTSFKKLVFEHLGIDPSYLVLARLGNNVSSFIDKSQSERKNYISFLMSEIEDYIKFYKNASEKGRKNKALLKVVTEKMSRLRVDSIEELNEEIRSVSKQLEMLQNSSNDIIRSSGSIEGQIKSYVNSLGLFDESDIRTYIKDNNDKLVELEKEISKFESKMDDYHDIKEVDNAISKLEGEVNKLKNRKDSELSILEFKRNQMGSLYNSVTTNKNKLNNIDTGKDIDELKEIIDHLSESVNARAGKFHSNLVSDARVDDYHYVLALCQELSDYTQKILSYDISIVREVLSHIKRGTNVVSLTNSGISKVNDSISYLNYRLNNLTAKENDKDVYILYFPFQECKDAKCMYHQYYLDKNDKQHQASEGDKIKKEIAHKNALKDKYESMEAIYNQIMYIKMVLNGNHKSIENTQIGKDTLNLTNIMNSLQNNKYEFYDEEKITEKINEIEDYNEFIKDKNELEKLKSEYEISLQYKDSIDMYRAEIKNAEEQLMKLEREVAAGELSLSELNVQVGVEEGSLNDLKEVRPLFENIDGVRKELEDTQNKIASARNIELSINELRLKLRSLERDKRQLDSEIIIMSNKLNERKIAMMNFNTFMKEKEELEEEYNIGEAIKAAVNPNVGIPVRLQPIFLASVLKNMNELLDIIYHGSLFIERFVITEKEFRIPYVKDGITINDVKFSSQGEKSMISIALSFALMSQSLDKYNIIILDEMDGALDKDTRPLFNQLLEKQLNMMGCEQCFVISHNGFEYGDLGIITTTNISDKDVKSGKYIWYKGKKKES